jgi:hypothetical protein
MKWLHNILKGASLTGALFVFQACYGIPQPALWEDGGTAPMSFSLVSRATGLPLEGIEIWANDGYGSVDRPLGVTDANGNCRVELAYRRNFEGPILHFVDPQEYYAVKDTSLADPRDRTVVVKMDSVQ